MLISHVRFDDFGGLEHWIEKGLGDWGAELEISQDMVERFAELSGDRQWIHVDPERARREGPFGAAVAHGMLVLSVIPSIKPESGWMIAGHGAAINYGSDGLRFLSPVRVGERIRARSRIAGAEKHSKGTLVTLETVVHVVNRDKPAMLYRAQILYMPPAE